MTLHWSTIAYLNVASIIMAKEHLDLFDGHAFVDCLCGKRSSELMRVDPFQIKLAPQFSKQRLDAANLQSLVWRLARYEEGF